MDIICFPFERVIEINALILKTEPGMKGAVDIPKLQGALGRIDNAIVYEGLDDVFEIAAKYTACIAVSHALPDANKRTGLAVALEYLSLNDFELTQENDLLADAVRDLVIGIINETDFADILYAQYAKEQNSAL
ncbi:type II toxin-antitoxin system death-on-curing family toxin [Vibrio cholerae]|uniref:Type II toxin-antitoxin system death-on-curing family toxin n=1 Tax=Vibrio navarrensis TaxID=29495 RepID=A0AAJ4LSR8_9VIBR|nr:MULTISPECIES: type II toxin-antitoxin system death-on-curing family toxin [Vibrio]EGR0582403.1 type II toxin-antitoxin system death-on-curing family toxin [Vibrio cholerae]EGR2027033.1 type II toxin-antitoxin system death-on-curing family toxin [Vibrio cholerae]EGR2120184.1 type II toxin-antitoxin system death-on-curing family toxin [Vibrio cholerae]EJL7978720.1 type II toxin-antitoxin system death-on-curing family toxin [Vibrio cholerae]EKF9488811.1 type II toxin-antitoxin system death-on-